MTSIGSVGITLAWGPKSLKVKCQAFSHSTGLKWPAPPSLPVTDNHTGLEPRMHLDVASRSENFLVDTGATYSVLTSYSRAFSSQACTIWGATGKTKKDSHEHFFVAGMDKYFPTSFWWSLSVLLPYWEEISPCLQNLAAISVLTEDALKFSLGGKLFLPATR